MPLLFWCNKLNEISAGNSYHALHLGTGQKMPQYYAINVQFHKVRVKHRPCKLSI